PVEVAVPMPVISTPPSTISATITAILKVPTSRPTTRGFRFAIESRPCRSFAASGRVGDRARAYDHLVSEQAAQLGDLPLPALPSREHLACASNLALEPRPTDRDRHLRPGRQQRESAPPLDVDLRHRTDLGRRTPSHAEEPQRPCEPHAGSPGR